ncbi:MAG: hypothetical protein U5N58_01465 [Actinomycetota bacterium]|nr:hypothetical protein [Actinomycetota bacterium]
MKRDIKETLYYLFKKNSKKYVLPAKSSKNLCSFGMVRTMLEQEIIENITLA